VERVRTHGAFKVEANFGERALVEAGHLGDRSMMVL
jgi:hypothetical protein